MRTLYLDCGMGAAGDMLTAALLELLPAEEAERFVQEMNELGLPGVQVTRETAVKCGITGTHITVTVRGEEECHEHGHGAMDHDHDGHEQGHDTIMDHEHDGQDQNHGAMVHEHDGHEHGHDTPDHDHDGYEHSHGTIDHEHDGHEQSHDTPDRTHARHHHSSLHDIEHIIRGHLALPRRVRDPEKVRSDILAVYRLIAEAESHVHGVPVTEIHFHEVGTMDAIADVTAVCLLMDRLAPDEVAASPVHVGSGSVRCAHGILPVPAPATAYILRDVPIYGGSVNGELCTPTGAALLKHFVNRFGDMPVMRTQAIGYGMGRKDFERANCVRAMIGETGDRTDTVLELSCNVDDMTAEEIGFAMEQLLAGGALEVYTIPIGMKKSRPGTLIRVMCREEEREKIVRLIYRHTTTIGIRETCTRRYVLKRDTVTLDTPWGPVRRKDSTGYGVTRSKLEYEDIARIAREQGVSLARAREIAGE